ncbi:MAG: hypothetical protein HFF09_03895 [Oscillospiraceae bacterium]|nr:hypothetical protein [Oscillospiraceae bacterium]
MVTPLRPSAADRRRPTPWDALAAVLVLALAAVLALALFRPPHNSGTVLTITQDGAEVAQYDLSALDGPLDVEVLGDYPLTVTLSPGGAAVTAHTCPGGDCARASLTAGKPGQLICLPNHTIITLGGRSSEIFDAVTG